MLLADLKVSWKTAQAELQKAISHAQALDVKIQCFLDQLQIAQCGVDEDRRQLERDRADLHQQAEEVEQSRDELAEEKMKMMKVACGRSDLVGLNFGGERTMMVKRSLLLQFEQSTLATMFSGRYEDQLDRDKDGNVFLDYSPAIMAPLIDYLRLHRDVAPGRPVQWPSVPYEYHSSWEAMLDFFGLSPALDKPTTTFSGIKNEVPISSLHGWTMFFCQPYNHASSMSDFVPPADLQGSALLVGARLARSEVLHVAAMGRADVITATRNNGTTRKHNGVHWYCYDWNSFGFAPSSKLKLSQADTFEPSCESRLSWHLTGTGGYRAGEVVTDMLNGNGTSWEKVIFVADVTLPD